MSAAIWGFIGTLVGALVSICTTYVSTWHASKLQSDADRLARAEKHRAFQQDTLLELQEALHALMGLVSTRLYGKHQSDSEAGKNDGEAGENEADENERLTSRRVAILIDRLSDDELSSDLRRFHIELTNLDRASTRKEELEQFAKLAVNTQEVFGRIGKELRMRYQDVSA